MTKDINTSNSRGPDMEVSENLQISLQLQFSEVITYKTFIKFYNFVKKNTLFIHTCLADIPKNNQRKKDA